MKRPRWQTRGWDTVPFHAPDRGSRALIVPPPATDDPAPLLAPPTPDELRRTDLNIATRIAGFAGMQTRDPRGNLSPEVWAQHSDQDKIGRLLDAETLKNLLVEQLRLQLDSQKELLKEVKAQIVIDFIIEYKQQWERRYREDIERNFDIAQRILSAMEDTVHEVEGELNASVVGPTALRHYIRAARYASDNSSALLLEDEALVRFYFRNPHTGTLFCRAAGKMLQKKEVCNKAGGYSAKQQRDDITQERDDAVLALVAVLNDPHDPRMQACAELAAAPDLAAWIGDHKVPTAPRQGLLEAGFAQQLEMLPDGAS